MISTICQPAISNGPAMPSYAPQLDWVGAAPSGLMAVAGATGRDRGFVGTRVSKTDHITGFGTRVSYDVLGTVPGIPSWSPPN